MNSRPVRNVATRAALILIMFLAWGCSPRIVTQSETPLSQAPAGIPDYANLSCWAAHPDKWDPSDSIPEPLSNGQRNQDADVFFLHPTSLTSAADTMQDNANINDTDLNSKTDYSSILYQASVFNGSCRVFAPRYRQAHLRMYYIADTARAMAAFDQAYQDIKQAFLYYLEHYHQGRPIIIASHSQGTTHAKRLLAEFFDRDTLIRAKLVAAYLLGIAVSKNEYEALEPCRDSLSIGCYISWRTYRKGFRGRFVSLADTSVSVINPYTWDSEQGVASRSMHKGAVLYNFNKVYAHTQSAFVAGNALWISRPKFPGGLFYTTKNYHAGDYNLFYLDIRDDISRRIRLYKNTRGS
jgi:Protein of unknown function (DUF3089)